MRVFALLLLVLSFTACDQIVATPDPVDPPVEASSGLIFAAQTEAEYRLQRLQGDQLEPFGPALPVDPQVAELRQVWALADASRVLVSFRAHEAPRGRTLLMGDGVSWWPIGAAEDAATVFNIKVSKDLGQVWVDHRLGTDEARLRHSVLYGADGAVLFDTGAPGPWATVPRLVTLAPPGAGGWFVTFDDERTLSWRSLEGAQRTLRTYEPVEGVYRNHIVYAAFAQSLLLWEEHPGLSWVDLHGAAHEVPGFSGDRTHVQGLFQTTGDTLERIDGAGVTPVLGWPAGLALQEVQAIEPNRWAVVSLGAGPVALDAQGTELDTFVAEPSTRDGALVRGFGTRSAHARVVGAFGVSSPTVLLQVQHDIFAGDVIDRAELTFELWWPATGDVVRIASFDPNDNPPARPRLTPDHRAVVWVEEGTVQRYDLATAQLASLPLDAEVLDVGRAP
jgi:hypothetical protein